MAQSIEIGCWLSKVEGDDFSAMARGSGLDESALATLLVVRELNVRWLESQSSKSSPPKVSKDKRITARPRCQSIKVRFEEYVKPMGLSMEAALAALSRKEIRENWLGKTIEAEGNHLDSPRETCEMSSQDAE